MINAIIGIVGTILGTVLGWLLNNLSRIGKLNVYVVQWKDEFQHQDSYGCLVKSSSKDIAEYYSFDLDLEIYNSSSDSEIMRGITVEFADCERVLFENRPFDKATIRRGPVMRGDEIGPINIPPKSVVPLKLHSGLGIADRRYDSLWRTNRVYFTYKDKKEKNRRVQVNGFDLAKHFD